MTNKEYTMYQQCPTCKGTGEIRVYVGEEKWGHIECKRCVGTGEIETGYLKKK